MACFQVDADRNVVALTPAMERLTGFRAADVLGRSCLTLHRCPECLKGCRIFEFGGIENARVTLYRADGTEVAVIKSGTALQDSRGRIAGALEVVRPLPPQAREERERLLDALTRSKHRRAEAARILGISRSTLWRRMREHGVD